MNTTDKLNKQLRSVREECERLRVENGLLRQGLPDTRRKKHSPVPRLSKHVVSYFDLLGMKRRMAETRNHPHAARSLLRAYARVFKVIRKELGAFDASTWKFKVFTDNIVLAVPVDDNDDAEGEIGDALITAGVLQVQLSIRGWFVRGGGCD